MLGKKIKTITILIFILTIISSCSNKEIKESFIDNKENYLTFQNGNYRKEELNDINTYFSDKTEIPYPENYNFTPLKLIENKFIVGKAIEINNNNNQFLSLYDIETKKLKTIKRLETFKNSDNLQAEEVKILDADNKNILYETFYNDSANYYIFNLENNTEKVINSQKNIPQNHNTQGALTDNYFALSTITNDGKNYDLKYYDLKDLKENKISEKNSGFPTFIKNKLYYLEIDGENRKTILIEYDINKKIKNVKYKTESPSEYLTLLTGNKENLLIGLRKEDKTYIYKMEDNKNASLYHINTWIETPEYKNNFLSYIGDKRDESRVRMQYFLINIENKKDIDNKNGIVYLSNKGTLWISYKTNDENIPKGKTFDKEYTKMFYSNYK